MPGLGCDGWRRWSVDDALDVPSVARDEATEPKWEGFLGGAPQAGEEAVQKVW